MYAADGALEIAAHELLAVADWNALLAGGALSAFVDGPPSGVRQVGDGTTIDLARGDEPRERRAAAVGCEQPRVAVVCVRMARSETYVIAWVADDPRRPTAIRSIDGGGVANPGAGIVALRAEAFGAGGAHNVLEATVRRDVGGRRRSS